MAVTDTIQLIKPYIEEDDGPLGLSSFFKVPVDGIHNKKKVKFHVRRSDRKIATPTRSPETGYRMNSLKGFTIKEVDPAVYKEGLAVSADEVMSGISIGKTPYDSPTIMGRIRELVEPTIVELKEMIKRAVELQASQILTTATVALVDSTGGTVFTENFAPKASHFPNASVAWTTPATAVPFNDMADVSQEITTDGKKAPKYAISNSVCFNDLKSTTQFKNGASSSYTGEVYRLDQSAKPIYPKLSNGMVFRGMLKLRACDLDYYTYDAWYEHPQTGTDTMFIPDNKFIICGDGRLDATFGKLNKFGMDQNAAKLVRTGRMANPDGLIDLSYNMWFSDDNEVFNFGTGSRVALGAVAIDTYGCITTKGF